MANLLSPKGKENNQSLISIVINLALLARPVHWIKNLSLFAAIVFSGNLLDSSLFAKVIWAFFAFSLATSATYIFNDILDIQSDRAHPIKRHRPLAAGKVPITIAFLASLALAATSLGLSLSLGLTFFTLVLTYLAIQLVYSLGLKNFSIIDILAIAAGFIIRVYAGAFVIDAHLSVWFLLCVISTALFLASGKRRAELNISKSTSGTTRVSLSRYKSELLNSYVTMFGNAAWLSWSLFTFFESPQASLPVWLFLAELSKTTTVNKLMMVTIPIVIFGIMRYEALIFEGKSEAPEKILLTDIALMFSVFAWIVTVVWVLYGGVAYL